MWGGGASAAGPSPAVVAAPWAHMDARREEDEDDLADLTRLHHRLTATHPARAGRGGLHHPPPHHHFNAPPLDVLYSFQPFTGNIYSYFKYLNSLYEKILNRIYSI